MKITYFLACCMVILTSSFGCSHSNGIFNRSVLASEKISGELCALDLNSEVQTEKSVLVVKTPQGNMSVNVSPETDFFLQGQECLLEDLGKLVLDGNTTYECTYFVDRENCDEALTVYIEMK